MEVKNICVEAHGLEAALNRMADGLHAIAQSIETSAPSSIHSEIHEAGVDIERGLSDIAKAISEIDIPEPL